MKRISTVLFLSLLAFLYMPVQAQFKQIAKSTPFDEPEKGEATIFSLNNNSTIYLYRNSENELSYKLFDGNHVEIISVSLNTQSPAKFTRISGPYEIANNIVLFLTCNIGNSIDLKRITISAASGKMLEDVILFSIAKGFFVVSKDPDSDSYAVMKTEIKSKDEIEKVVILFGNGNKELCRGSFTGPNNDQRDFIFTGGGFIVNNDKVFIPGLQLTGKIKYGVYKGNRYMGLLQKDSAGFTYFPLDFPADIDYKKSVIKYNPGVKKIYYVLHDENNLKGRVGTALILNIFDPVLKKATKVENLEISENLNNAYKARFRDRFTYWGTPQDFFINDDGSFTVLYQEDFMDQSKVILGKILTANYNKEGLFISGYFLPKLQTLLEYSYFKNFRNSENESVDFSKGDQYKLPKYVNGTKQKYLLFNDTERNNNAEKDKYIQVTGLALCDGFVYKLSGDDITPKRDYVFGADPNKHSLGNFAISDYNKNTNTFVTLRTDKESGKGKMVNIVWLQPQ